MSLHDELVASAADLLADVQGEREGLCYTDALGRVTVLDVVSWGEVRVEVEEVNASGGMLEEQKVERRAVKVRPPAGENWTPQLHGTCEASSDLGASAAADVTPSPLWSVDSYSGVGTAVVTLRLVRKWQTAKGRTGLRGGRAS